MKDRTGVKNLNPANDNKPDNDTKNKDLRARVLKEMALKLAGRWSDMYATAPKE